MTPTTIWTSSRDASPVASRRVFFSYSHDERPFAEAVAAALEPRGVKVMHVAHERDSGAGWGDALRAALGRSDTFVVFVGRAPSTWTNFELGAALGSGKPVLSVHVGGAGAGSLPGPLAPTQVIDAADLPPGEVAERIARAVAQP